MNISIEKNLQQYKTHIIDHATLSTVLVNNGHTGINDKINKLKKEGLLETLKRGLYLHKSPFNKTFISKEIIANTLLSPSYISFDYALCDKIYDTKDIQITSKKMMLEFLEDDLRIDLEELED